MSDPSTPPRGPFEAPPYLGQRRQRGLLGWVVLVVAAVLIGGLIWWVVSNKAKESADQGGGFGPPGVGGPPGASSGGGRKGRGGAIVNAARTEKGDMPVVVSALGTVTPSATVTVKSQISGQLMSVAFQEGQMVTKGQVLAQIDPRPYEQQLAQAEATLAKDEAQLANARADLKRYQTLLAQDSVSRQQVDTQAALVRQLDAQTKADRAAVGAQKLNIAYTRVTAPVAGRVGLRQIDPGNYVTPGDSNGLVTVATFAPIDVAFSLPEDVLPKIVAARKKGAKTSVEVLDRAQTAVLARGELASLDNLIDTTTGTIRAKARFANADGSLFPNQFVNVRLTTEVLKSVVIAPTSAVLRGQQGMFVYVVDAERKVHIRSVQPGAAQGERTAILSGLSVGETLVTDGTDRLREGMSVSIPPPCAPGAGGGYGGARKPGGSGAAGPGAAGPGAARSGSGSSGCRPAAGPASAMAASGGGDSPSGQARRQGGDPGAAPVAAAGPGGEASGASSGGSGRMQAMLADLKLDAAQQAKADAILSEAREKAQAGLPEDADPDTRRAVMRKAMGEALGRLSAVLRPDQKAKLAEIRAKMAAGGGPGGGDQGGGPKP